MNYTLEKCKGCNSKDPKNIEYIKYVKDDKEFKYTLTCEKCKKTMGKILSSCKYDVFYITEKEYFRYIELKKIL